MNIIPLPDPPPPSPAQRSALSILAHVNSAAGQAVQRQTELYRAFWDSPSTPDDILAEMSTNAGRMLAAAGESVRHLEALAEIAGVELADLIPLEYVIPRREFIPAADGTATLAPPEEGFDAWGRPIPEEVEEIETGVGEGDMPEID